MHDIILIVDFGSQVTQLIARRVREHGVYCEIVPFNKAAEAFAQMKPRAIILSGGPGLGARSRCAAAAAGILYRRRADPRHLLRRAGDGPPARRQGRGRPSPRVRPRRGRGDAKTRLLRRRLAARREIPGVDEPWRPGDRAAAGLPRGRDLAQCADRRDRRRGAALLRDPVPPRGGAHPARRGAAAQFRARRRGLGRRLDHARLQGRGDRKDPPRGRAARAA